MTIDISDTLSLLYFVKKMLEHQYDVRISEKCVDPNPLMVVRQDPDNFTRFQTRERCALEIAAYVFNAGQKYCRMLQGEHSAILSTFIKVPFVIKVFVLSIFEWPLKTGFAYMYNTKTNGFLLRNAMLESSLID